MSDPSTTPLPHPSIIPGPPHHLPLTAPPPPPPSSLAREYRKGNWTIQETLILITAKKLDDERRLRTSTTPHDPNTRSRSSTGELRWKWVENYCWSHGCLRSQNQCNDKWDNLLRDYKKVRDYESKFSSTDQPSTSNNNNVNDAVAIATTNFPSYWSLNKQQRKEQNLPSNMLFEVYQAITQVLQRKQSQRNITTTTTPQPQQLVTLVTSPPPPPPLPPSQPQSLQTQLPPPLPPLPPPPPPPTQPHAPTSSTTPVVSERSESSDSEHDDEDEEEEGSESKRRKVRNLGSSIMRSASVLARALRNCEKKKEKRHREMIELEQRRIQMEEARNETHRQGIATLVAAVTNLSGAIQSFINSERRTHR